MKNQSLFNYVNSRSCALLGLGVSNLPLARQLCDFGVRVCVIDKKSVAEIGEGALSLSERGVEFLTADADFSGIDAQLIFRSPGIRPDKKGIVAAVDSGAELTSEMELFLKLTPAKTFAVTGSDGKTTTTTLTGKFLEADGCSVYVGGNIGTPLLCRVGEMTEKDKAVLELSSFQLMTVSDAPKMVAVTNVSPNHLDWHTDMKEYVDTKKKIVGKGTERLVTNADCDATLELAKENCATETVLFSSRKTAVEVFSLCPTCKTAITLDDGFITVTENGESRALLDTQSIRVPGRHNIENFMTAIGLTWGEVSVGVYEKVAKEFLGVEHRLEFVRELGGVRYYNSSIDSSPTRTAAALSAMARKSLVIICGGYDKNLDYTPLGEAICAHGGIKAVILTGQTGEKIYKAITECSSTHPALIKKSDFEEAVNAAKEQASEGDCVLLTPASASFDAFKNFDERGKRFKRIVNAWN